jgi:hypothetical protein
MFNQGPPANIQPSSLAAALMGRPRPSRVIQPWQGNETRIRIIVPAELEHAEAKLAAEQIVREEFKKRYKREPTADDLNSPANAAAIGDASGKEILARCCFEPDPFPGTDKYIRIFPHGNYLSQALSAEEISILFFQFQLACIELGPREQTLLTNPEVIRMWIERVKDKAWSMAPLSSLAWVDLAELCLYSLIRIQKLESTGPGDEADSQPPSSVSTGESDLGNSVELTTSSGGSVSSTSQSTPVISAEELLPTESVAKAAEKLVRKTRKQTK